MDVVAVLRRFDRWYTRRVPVLAESCLDSGRPHGPLRLLYALGTGPTRVADLRRELDLDSGYLSRLLRQLEQDGLVTVAPAPDDGRQRVVHLTPAGRRERQHLDRKREDIGRRLLAPLPERRRVELALALATAERLLRAATVDIDPIDPRSRSGQSALTQYFAELDDRLPDGFRPGDERAALAALRPPDGGFLVLRSERITVGCGGVQRIDDGTGEIKRMWIHPDWRGLGLGGRLLARLETVARELGYTRVVLDTNGSLVEAIAMYERAGYGSIQPYNDNPYAQRWFAKDL